jgi:predicted translin family RNA/ssDNA-binding protein
LLHEGCDPRAVLGHQPTHGLVKEQKRRLRGQRHRDLQDALKEYAEANIVHALIIDNDLPSPEELGLEYATYLKGLAEATGELRRRCLDILRHGYSDEAERLLNHMDDIYSILVTMDYPDAITGDEQDTCRA